VQKSLEFPRIAAIATSAVVVASAFAITPATSDVAEPRSPTADVALVATVQCTPPPGGPTPPGSGGGNGSCTFVATAAQAYANLFAPFTQPAVDWIADPGLNGWWNVEPATPSDEDVYALQQASDGRWLLSAPTGDEEEELVRLVAAAEQQGWTLQSVSEANGIGQPVFWVGPHPQGEPSCIWYGCLVDTPTAAGIGAVTAAIANPFAIFRQVANNMAYYAGLFAVLPAEEAIATIVATVATHAQAVGVVAEGLIPGAIEGVIKRNQALLDAAQKAVGYVVTELTTNFGSGQAVEAFRAGFLSPRGYDGTVASSIPGTFLAGATGPGIIANPADCSDTCYVASVVVQNQGARARIVDALGGVGGQPVPGCSSSTGSCEPPAATRAQALAHPQPAAARSATSTTNVRAAATTPSAAVDSASDITTDSVADTAAASTDTVRKPAGTHRASRSAASRAAAS
jgi:hypothetical protein